jgi:hypothetical protein
MGAAKHLDKGTKKPGPRRTSVEPVARGPGAAVTVTVPPLQAPGPSASTGDATADRASAGAVASTSASAPAPARLSAPFTQPLDLLLPRGGAGTGAGVPAPAPAPASGPTSAPHSVGAAYSALALDAAVAAALCTTGDVEAGGMWVPTPTAGLAPPTLALPQQAHTVPGTGPAALGQAGVRGLGARAGSEAGSTSAFAAVSGVPEAAVVVGASAPRLAPGTTGDARAGTGSGPLALEASGPTAAFSGVAQPVGVVGAPPPAPPLAPFAPALAFAAAVAAVRPATAAPAAAPPAAAPPAAAPAVAPAPAATAVVHVVPASAGASVARCP